MSVNIPIVNAPYLNVQGLQIAVTGNATATVAPGQARDSTNTNDIIQTAVVTLNTAVNGINGLDTGTLAASTLYALYSVGDSTENSPAGVTLSLNGVTPLLPVNYDMFRLIGYLRTNSSSFLLLGYWSGTSNDRTFWYDAPITVGSTVSSSTYAAINLTNLVPLVNDTPVILDVSLTGTAADTMNLQPGAATGNAITLTAAVTSQAFTTQVTVLAQNTEISSVLSPTINYKNSGTDTIAITVAGYKYTI